jgi:hypothetical protein
MRERGPVKNRNERNDAARGRSNATLLKHLQGCRVTRACSRQAAGARASVRAALVRKSLGRRCEWLG